MMAQGDKSSEGRLSRVLISLLPVACALLTMGAVNLSPKELKAMRDSGRKIRLIDVREQDEWDAGHLEGAELIPLSQFQSLGPEKLDPDDAIVLYCHHGVRSAQAQGYLKSQGYTNVLNLTGGIDAWSLQVDPKMKRY